jgi:putative hydrolase of the HAD superfamily
LAARRGLLVDYGGVLTTDVFASFSSFCTNEGLAPETVRDVFMTEGEGRRLLAELELGRLEDEEFERRLAPLLGLGPERAPQLINRIFAGMSADPAMLEALIAARRGGVRTALISNSWGHRRYDHDRFPELFDAVVISGEVGLRKPDPAIYALAAERIGLAPDELVFVDDLGGNLKPARAMGMATVLHRAAEETIPQLEELLEVALTR